MTSETTAVVDGTPRSAALDRLDALLLAALLAAHAGLRLAWASGLGLGDDVNLRTDIASIVYSGRVMPSPKTYRVTWWLPTAVSARVFGLGDVGLILPILLASTLGAAVVYALGKRLYGRAGGVIAGLLLLVHPLDFAWSTMLAEDIVVSATSALAVLLVVAALDAPDPDRARRRWLGAGLAAGAAFYAKISAIFLAPAFLAIAWLRRRRLGREAWLFPGTVLGVLAAGTLLAYAFTGDPFVPYTYEIHFQGLDRAAEVARRRLTTEVFWRYPRWLFWTNQLGDMPNAIYAWLVVALALVRPRPSLPAAGVALFWLLAVFFGYQLNAHRVDGVWVSGFRNIRHTHVFVYPLVLLLTGQLTALLRGRRAVALAVLVVALAAGLWQSVRVANRTRPVFRELRAATTLLGVLPGRPVQADFQFHNHMTFAGLDRARWRRVPLHASDADVRRHELATARSGYAITGGSREPYYGCRQCIPRASELRPEQWRLLYEWAPPPPGAPWWPEPLRLWQWAADAPRARDERGS